MLPMLVAVRFQVPIMSSCHSQVFFLYPHWHQFSDLMWPNDTEENLKNKYGIIWVRGIEHGRQILFKTAEGSQLTMSD